MGRPKGGKNKTHTKEEKIKYVKMMLEDGYSAMKQRKRLESHFICCLFQFLS